MRDHARATGPEHRTAMERIRALFECSKPKMNGRDLRIVVKAYLEERGCTDLPFRARTVTEHQHGLQKQILTLTIPDVSELHSHERVGIEDVPVELTEGLADLLGTWFEQHRTRLTVSSTTGSGRYAYRQDVRYDSWQVDVDPWFFDRD